MLRESFLRHLNFLVGLAGLQLGRSQSLAVSLGAESLFRHFSVPGTSIFCGDDFCGPGGGLQSQLDIQNLAFFPQLAEAFAEVLVLEVAAGDRVLVLLMLVAEVDALEVVEVKVVDVRVFGL